MAGRVFFSVMGKSLTLNCYRGFGSPGKKMEVPTSGQGSKSLQVC